MKTKTLAIAFLLFAVLASVWVIGMDIDSPNLGEAILRKVGAAGGFRLKASRFKWNLTRGLVAEEVEAHSGFPGGRFTVHIDRILFEHEWLPLLTRKVVIKRLILKQPRAMIVKARNFSSPGSAESGRSDSGSRVPSPSKASMSFDPILRVLEFLIEDGALVTQGFQSGGSGVSLVGLDLAFRNLQFQTGAITPLHGLVAQAEIEARTMDVDSIRLREVSGRVDFNRGRVAVADLNYSTPNGAFTARIGVDFNQIPLGYELSLESDHYNIGAYVGARDNDNFPLGSLSFEATGYGTDLNNASGQGVLRLNEGVLPAFPLVTEAEKSLGRDGLAGSSFEPLGIPFEAKNGHLVVPPFVLRTEGASTTIGGSVGSEGSLALSFTVEASDGSGVSHFRVSGTLDQPLVEVVTNSQ